MSTIYTPTNLEERLNMILNDENLFSGGRKVEVLKAIAESQCRATQLSKKKIKAIGEEEAKKRYERCLKRKFSLLWWSMLRQREPVQIGNLVVKIEGSDVKIEKRGA